jgi:hypothetical protein
MDVQAEKAPSNFKAVGQQIFPCKIACRMIMAKTWRPKRN